MRGCAILAVVWSMGLAPVAASDAVLSLWRDWVRAVGASESAIAVMQLDDMAYAEAIGQDLDAPRPVHSVSKMITGACVTSLVEDALLTYQTGAGEVIQADRSPGGALNVAQLLTHTGGLGPDETQNAIRLVTQPRSFTDELVAKRALARRLRPETGHAYNNENYAILGMMIASVTGQSVEDACRARVLGGLASAQNREGQGSGLSYGGWALSMPDLARFGAAFDLPVDAPRANVSPGIDYGPGVLIRDTDAGPNLWHYGGLCAFGRGSGAALFILPHGLTMAVSYNVCASAQDLRQLEQTVLAPAARAMLRSQ
ncbi:MAG: serine hydrolase domain-containing protein [Pseudomonadota bacterium]